MLKRITEISVEEADSIRGGKECSCSGTCSCSSSDLTSSVKEADQNWTLASNSAG